VSEDVWSASGTTPDEVQAALRRLLRERHAADAGLVPARVLNLVVVVDCDLKGAVEDRLAQVGRYHASRTILCAVRDGRGEGRRERRRQGPPGERSELDARAVITYADPSSAGANGSAGGPGVIHEHVELDLPESKLKDLATIVDPVLVSELPTILWCPHGHLDDTTSLLRLIDVILLDSDEDDDPASALERAAELSRSSYVVDLAWLRTTPWRERLAATFDPPYRRCELPLIAAVSIRHHAASSASALLLTGWLASRLGWEPSALEPQDGALRGRTLRSSEPVAIALEPAPQDVPGLAGVTVTSRDGFSLSLDRAPGGLLAHRCRTDGTHTSWKVLGASRGEGGILGEGVRQALLRDPTYPPALACARRFCTA
jgi:glucose-6-phosphate dehydrogenase assembly protein OpcA